jgi:hypothetical protein
MAIQKLSFSTGLLNVLVWMFTTLQNLVPPGIDLYECCVCGLLGGPSRVFEGKHSGWGNLWASMRLASVTAHLPLLQYRRHQGDGLIGSHSSGPRSQNVGCRALLNGRAQPDHHATCERPIPGAATLADRLAGRLRE